MADLLIELRGGDADVDLTELDGEVSAFIVRWDGVANDYQYALDTFECADDLPEPERSRIRDTVAEIWPAVAEETED